MRSDFDECASVWKALNVRHRKEIIIGFIIIYIIYIRYTYMVCVQKIALGLVRALCVANVAVMNGNVVYEIC